MSHDPTAPDEIDTIGRARGNSQGADSDEREQGLLQLLVEMDGFDSKREKVRDPSQGDMHKEILEQAEW